LWEEEAQIGNSKIEGKKGEGKGGNSCRMLFDCPKAGVSKRDVKERGKNKNS